MKRLYSGFEELSDDAAMVGSALEVVLISAVWLSDGQGEKSVDQIRRA
jgi:hypothetical protein